MNFDNIDFRAGPFDIYLRRWPFQPNQFEVYVSSLAGNKRQALRRDENGDYQYIEVPEGSAEPEPPTMMLPEGVLQGIMEEMWRLGFRPKDIRYEREIDLLNAHLEDMRKLVFMGAEKVLEQEKPCSSD